MKILEIHITKIKADDDDVSVDFLDKLKCTLIEMGIECDLEYKTLLSAKARMINISGEFSVEEPKEVK